MVAAPESIVQQPQAVDVAPAQPNGQAPVLGQQVGAKPARENGVDGAIGNGHPESINGTQDGSSPQPSIPPPDIARQIPCRFFPLGSCKYGNQCAFSHDASAVAPANPSGLVVNSPPLLPSTNGTAAQVLAPGEEPTQQQIVDPAMAMYYAPPPIEYGTYDHFSPPQGYYAYPPFQHYPPYPPPQAYYPMPPQTASAAGDQASATASTSPQPVSDNLQLSSPPTAPADFASSPPPAQPYMPYLPQTFPGAPTDFSVYPSHPPPSQAPATTASTPATAAPSLHTFFQTSGHLNAAPFPPKSSTRPPNIPAGRGRGGSSANFAFGRSGPKRTFDPKGPRPPCSFFEANRCRNKDDCPFPHILPDGTDARSLRRNLIGVDGRVENPEERGGVPPAWISAQRDRIRNPLRNSHGPGSPNHGPSFGLPKTTRRFEDEQHRQELIARAHQQGIEVPPQADAPSLVAAINRLTRGIPPASGPQTATASQGKQSGQRVPSNDDFPALSSAPMSPAIEKDEPTVPVSAAGKTVADVVAHPPPVPAASLEKAPSQVTEPTVQEEPAASSPSEPATNAVVSANVSDSAVSTASEAPALGEPEPIVVPTPAAAPAPKISFASAAAKGAAIPTPVNEKAKKPATNPVSVKVEEKEKDGKEDGQLKKERKKGVSNGSSGTSNGERREQRSSSSTSGQVSVKA